MSKKTRKTRNSKQKNDKAKKTTV
ncbi:uncharacterized protein METZ01_LOCUS396371, partial [marine metagenome]